MTDMVLSDMSGNVLYDQNRDNSGQEESGYKPQVSGSDLLTVTGVGSVMKAEQSAESGYITQSAGDAGVNTSYILLPENDAFASMSMTLKLRIIRLRVRMQKGRVFLSVHSRLRVNMRLLHWDSGAMIHRLEPMHFRAIG